MKGAAHDIWSVNVEADYHEEKSAARTAPAGTAPDGTGRRAPIVATIPARGSDCPGIRDNS